ncbi:polymeric immunoglobulin receptor-like isoform X2 [Tachysurus vachellii]|uniref:polymeric immunoglobulin receptor-like isoform X2 n=1 Tax=Tachysurus vachellii TaxID=175792 RepID=UPI00296B0AED|nr:polymeric immunoglobulin receptor-like isoform X2 [Tachysurus vachellii]
MKILLIFTLCLISDGGAAKEVTGYSGRGILIKCKYDTEYRYNKKYFCKSSLSVCSEKIKTGAKNQWVNSGRFSLFDDTRSSEFWVMIRELTVQDTGTYHCGVDRTLDTDIYTPVELKVKQGSLVSVTAYAGGGINIKCRYDDEYKNLSKSFCKIGTHQRCFNQKQTKPNSEWSHDGRFSIHDNRSAGFFSVFITELIIGDTGKYACGVVVFDKPAIYTAVKLNVTEDLSHEKFISKTVNVGEDLTVTCNYPKFLSSDPKFLCKTRWQDACYYNTTVEENGKSVNKGKISLYDDRAKQNFTVSIRDVTEQDSGEYWCGAEKAWASDNGYKVYFTQINLTVTLINLINQHEFPSSTVISVSVCLLVLLLFGVSVSFVFFWHKMQGKSPIDKSSVHCSGNNQENEEVKNTRRLSASDAAIFTLYASAQLPTIPSEPSQTVYSNTKFPTSSCNSNVYSIAELPTIPPDQDVYSTAQLPTDLSDTPGGAAQESSEKSAEDLTYTAGKSIPPPC